MVCSSSSDLSKSPKKFTTLKKIGIPGPFQALKPFANDSPRNFMKFGQKESSWDGLELEFSLVGSLELWIFAAICLFKETYRKEGARGEGGREQGAAERGLPKK